MAIAKKWDDCRNRRNMRNKRNNVWPDDKKAVKMSTSKPIFTASAVQTHSLGDTPRYPDHDTLILAGGMICDYLFDCIYFPQSFWGISRIDRASSIERFCFFISVRRWISVDYLRPSSRPSLRHSSRSIFLSSHFCIYLTPISSLDLICLTHAWIFFSRSLSLISTIF